MRKLYTWFALQLLLVITLTIFCSKSSGLGPDPYQLTWQQGGFLDRRDFGAAVVTDSIGNVYVGGDTGDVFGTPFTDYSTSLVLKYDSSGSPIWLTKPYPTGGSEDVTGMAIDAASNVVVAGTTYRYKAGGDAYVAKVDAGGNLLWLQRLGTAKNDFGHDVAFDALGNVYVCGQTFGDLGSGAGLSSDWFVAKYSSAGDLLWTKQPGNNVDEYGIALNVNALGDIYLVYSKGSNRFLSKLDPSGNVLWNETINYSSSSSLRTELSKMTLDSVGNIYLCGFTDGAYDSALGYVASDAVVAKHDANGNLLWERQIETSANEKFISVAVDSTGNVFVSGETYGSVTQPNAGLSDSLWAKYDAAGNLLWTYQFGTPDYDLATGIAVDAFGRVYVAGARQWTVNGNYVAESDAFLARFDSVPEPATIWVVAVGLLAMSLCRVVVRS